MRDAMVGSVVLCLVAGATACSEQSSVGMDRGVADLVRADGPLLDSARIDTARADRGVADSARPDRAQPDLAVADASRPDRSVPDRAVPVPDRGTCFCKAGEAWQRSSCVETTKLYTCGPRCTSGSCASGWSCDSCAAAPSCVASACAPVCVRQTWRPMSGPLRSSPTSGTAGTKHTLTIEGWPFQIGALFHGVRFNGTQSTMVMSVTRKCQLKADFTPAKPGVYTVEVSQYGGAAPWVLAGFFTASGGVIPAKTAQPGRPCNATTPCAQGPGYTCSCTAGRCVCK